MVDFWKLSGTDGNFCLSPGFSACEHMFKRAAEQSSMWNVCGCQMGNTARFRLRSALASQGDLFVLCARDLQEASGCFTLSFQTRSAASAAAEPLPPALHTSGEGPFHLWA